MKLEVLIFRLRIQEHHRDRELNSKDSEHVGKANLTEARNDQRKPKLNTSQGKKFPKKNQNRALKPRKDIAKKKDVECFVCGKNGHCAMECSHREGNKGKNQTNYLDLKLITILLTTLI